MPPRRDTCAGAATNPNFLVTIGGVNYCDQSNSSMPWRTQFKIAGSVPLPWYGLQAAASFQALPGYLLGTQALTAGGAGVPNFTSFSGVASSFTVTPTTRYTVCPGNSASQGCTVGALVFLCITFTAVNPRDKRPVFTRLFVTGYRNYVLKIRQDWPQNAPAAAREVEAVIQAFASSAGP